MSIFVPAAPRGIATSLALRDWVNDRHFPAHAYFISINNARRCLDQLGDKDDPEAIVAMMAITLKRDERFISYVLEDCAKDVTELDEWSACFEAFAWILVQRYYRDIERDEWDPDD